MWSDRNIVTKDSATLATLRVLLVDDHPNIRSLLTTILNALGVVAVTTADCAEVALGFLAKSEFDLLITDFDMPGMGGEAMVKTIRRNARSVVPAYDSRIPILAITSNITRRILDGARDMGIDEILAKPFSATLVSERLSAIINNRREFIICDSYIGPCRRRGLMLAYEGPMRRDTDLEELPALEIECERVLLLDEAKALCRFVQFGERLGVGECESAIATSISISQRAIRIRNPVIERAASSLLKYVQTSAAGTFVATDVVQIHGHAMIELLDNSNQDDVLTQRVLSGLEAAVTKRLLNKSAA